MLKTERKRLKTLLSIVLVFTLAFPAMTGMAAAETNANQLYITVDGGNTAYDDIKKLPGNCVDDIRFYYPDDVGVLITVEGEAGLEFPQKVGSIKYKGSNVWEWDNTDATPGVYQIKFTKDYMVYSMNFVVYCNPSTLNFKWNSDKTAAIFTRAVGVDYYVAQISVNGKEISRKAITGSKISLSKEAIAAACEKSAKTAEVTILLTPFGRDADCRAYIKGQASIPLCQAKVDTSFKVSKLIPEKVKTDEPKEVVKDEPAKEEVKEESKQEIKDEPVKEEVKEDPIKEEVKQDTAKEETKQEVKEDTKKEESTEPVKTPKQSTIDGIQNTTIKVNTKFIMNLYGGDKIKVTWAKSPGYKVDYYQVYRSMSKSKGFKKAFTTKNGNVTTYINTGGIVKFKTYYYKVRGVREINGQKYYTKWSNVKKQIFA